MFSFGRNWHCDTGDCERHKEADRQTCWLTKQTKRDILTFWIITFHFLHQAPDTLLGKNDIYPSAICLYLTIVPTNKMLFSMTGPCKRNIARWKRCTFSLTCKESFITLGSNYQTINCDLSKHTCVPVGASVFLSCLNITSWSFVSL